MIRQVAGNYFLFSDENDLEHPVVLNETGYYIYERLSSGDSVEQIAKRMSKEYDIPFEEALSDINGCREELLKHSFLNK